MDSSASSYPSFYRSVDGINNCYEATLTRSSIRKHTNGIQATDSSENGDVSLGLSLKIIAGKCVVRQVKPQLIDGSESPVANKISRGDVILSVNGCLVEASNMMQALQPVLSPNKEGIYEKTIHLELARGAGVMLLDQVEDMEEKEHKEIQSNINKPGILSRLWRRRRSSAAEEGYASITCMVSEDDT